MFRFSWKLFFFFLFTASLLAQDELKKVTLQLSWFNQFQFAGYYVAKEKGYYAQAGLDVEIKPFAFGLNIPQNVADAKVDFAIGRETLLLERANGKKIVALYALFQVSPLILIAKEDSHIKSLSDFSSKRIMGTINDSSEVSLKAMLNSAGIKETDYHFIEHSHNVQDLLDNKVDIMSAYISKAPFELKEKNVPYTVFSPQEYGFDMYSDFLYTSETLIQKDSNTINAFKEASLKGWQYAYSHLEETSDLILQRYNTQNLSKEELLYEAQELRKLSFYKTETLGKIQKSKLQRIYDLYNVMGFIPKKLHVEEFVLHNFGELTKKERQYLQNKQDIKICSDPDWMPFEQINNGTLTGISADYLPLMEKNIGIPFTLVPTQSWAESLRFAQERKCDIFSLAMATPERLEYMNFTKPYISVPLVIATTMDKFFISNTTELLDKKIGVVQGYAWEELLKIKNPKIKIIRVKNVEDGLQKVAKGELDGFIDTLTTIGHIIQKEYPNVLKIGGKIEDSLELAFGARNDEPLLINILSKALDSINENTKESINNKWMNIRYETKFDYALFWKMAGLFTLIFLILAYRYFVVQKYNKQIKKNMEVINQYVLFLYANTQGKITTVSDALCKLCGYEKKELLGQTEAKLQHPDFQFYSSIESLEQILQGQTWEGELKNIKKDGTLYWVYVKMSPLISAKGKIEGYSSFQTDITDKKRIEEISHTDQLTQISNRLHLDLSFKQEFTRASRYASLLFSVLLMDIDYFKEINDTHGHSLGDTILVELVSLIKTDIRDSDVFGRWGGEEFLIICPNTHKEEAYILAQKIRKKIHTHHFIQNISFTCSFGIAQYQKNDTKDTLFSRADKALYRAKKEGRNRVIIE